MKKIIIAASMLLTVSAFANETKVNPKVLNAFQTEFTTAQQVEWTVTPDYYRASFDMNGQKVFAFYNSNGELMGLSRNISSAQLPLHLQNSIKKNYESYWISDLFEIANNDGTSYYITLEDGDKKVVLKSADNSDWSTYKKERKI